MKKLLELRFWIFRTVLITAILDLIGLGGKADIGLGFILAVAILIFIVFYHPKK